MAETPEQVRPLAPAADRPTISDDEAPTTTTTAAESRRRKRWKKCCAFSAALLLLQAIAVVIIIFTVFRVKDPIIRMKGVTFERLDLISGDSLPRPGSNITLNVDVSVKNPNFGSFMYQNTTTAIYYRGAVISEAHGPPGRARARRTMRMNLKVDVMMDRVLSQLDLVSDINSGLLTVSTYTAVGGRVKIWMIKKHVTVRMNCSMVVNITNQAIQKQECRRKVNL
ncbi:hypothetical protein OROHE_005028 [Orobanche hederae]